MRRRRARPPPPIPETEMSDILLRAVLAEALAPPAMAPGQIAQVLAALGIPPPRRRPWTETSALRLLKEMAPFRPLPNRDPQGTLRDLLRAMSEAATRAQLGIAGPAMTADQRQEVEAMLAARPALRITAECHLARMAPEVSATVMGEARRARQPVPLDRVFAGPAPRWTLAELLAAAPSTGGGEYANHAT
jgi:hypothetical protein